MIIKINNNMIKKQKKDIDYSFFRIIFKCGHEFYLHDDTPLDEVIKERRKAKRKLCDMECSKSAKKAIQAAEEYGKYYLQSLNNNTYNYPEKK